MKKIPAIFTGALLFFNQSFAFAERFDITIMGVDLNQQTFFVGVNTASTSSPCARKNEFKWRLADSGTKEIISLALTAKATNKKIEIGTSSNCVADQATGSFMYVVP